MESPKQPENIKETSNDRVFEMVQKFGIGHMQDNVLFSPNKIKESVRTEVVDTYKNCTVKIESLLEILNSLVNEINTAQRSPEVFDDILSGILEALYKTANQILYHAIVNPEESLTAFDEFMMVIELVNQSILSPEILKKKEYSKSAIYELSPKKDMEGFTIKSFDTLFSKDHVAFNVTSTPLYQDTEKTIKSGIRLDYGPLYKETSEGIDATKTEWTTSVDVSGYYIDKIMNLYSPRGHHFTKIFYYKINLIMKSIAKHMEQHFDKSVK